MLENVIEEAKGLWNKVSSFFNDVVDYVARVIEYSPVLWQDRDYDYRHILTMLQYKLKRTREHITEHQFIQDADLVGEQIAHAEELLRRVLNDDYCKEEQAAHEAKWGDTVDLSHPSEDHPGFFEWDMSRANVHTPEEKQQEKDEQMIIYERMELARELDLDELFAHIRKNIQRWWD